MVLNTLVHCAVAGCSLMSGKQTWVAAAFLFYGEVHLHFQRTPLFRATYRSAL